MDNAHSKLEACDATIRDAIWTSGGGVLIEDICWLFSTLLFQAAFEGLHKKVCNLGDELSDNEIRLPYLRLAELLMGGLDPDSFYASEYYKDNILPDGFK